MFENMTRKKTKRQLEDEAFEELKRKAMEPFKPRKTIHEILEEEARIREESLRNYHKLKEEISDSEMENIKSRADFTHGWSD